MNAAERTVEALRLRDDLFLYGVAFMTEDGRRVSPEDVVVDPDGDCATDHDGRVYRVKESP